MTKIALLGRPNVGKSSLFNRMAKERIAITSDVSGTTRDTRDKEIFINEKPCTIIDTGGLDDSNELFENVRNKSLDTAKKAHIILYMVDGKSIPQDEDKKIFYDLQKLNVPIALVVNKVDNEKDKARFFEFYEFGADNIFALSVSHNRGTGKLYSWLDGFLKVENSPLLLEDEDESLESFLKLDPQENEKDFDIHVGIIGRTNVGKSSLLNAILKEDRSIVSSIAGTTIDPVDESLECGDYTFHFVDTAGLRKRSKIEGIERYALNRTEKVLEKTDIALLVLDASDNFYELDERIANLVDKFKLGCIIVLNKWDESKFEYKEACEEIRDRFKFLSYAPIITLSALTKKRVDKVRDLIIEVYEQYSKRIPTSKLNELMKIAVQRHPIPSDKGKLVRIYFATQFDVKPPKIALVMNKPKHLHFSYKRYLSNKLRESFNLTGTPIILLPRARGQKDEEMIDEHK
ncbi:MAG: ribosome biogenesis GTPase Der [Proteobacteria bacterium]|nr:MAG: ribosome biogenesis GTPase Der [Pseudomonadota bacterium]